MNCLDDVLNELRDVLARKNADYGNAAFLPAPLAPNLEPATTILIRMGDKIRRLENLAKKDRAEVDESFDDTVLDLAGYCVLYLARKRAERSKR